MNLDKYKLSGERLVMLSVNGGDSLGSLLWSLEQYYTKFRCLPTNIALNQMLQGAVETALERCSKAVLPIPSEKIIWFYEPDTAMWYREPTRWIILWHVKSEVMLWTL